MTPPIVQLGVAYGAGLWAGLVFLFPDNFALLLVGAAAVVTFLSAWRRVIAFALVVGFGSGHLVDRHVRRSCARVWSPEPKSVFLAVNDGPDATGRTTATVIYAREGCGGTLTLRVHPELAPPGATIVAVGLYRGRGVLRVAHARVLGETRAWRFRVRAAVARRIAELYGPRAGVVEALVLGRRSGIDPGLRREFTDAGLAHLLAISGLHVGVLAGWVVILFRLAGLRRSAWLWGALLTWGYVTVLGFPASAVRAAAFLSVFAVSRMRQRHPPPSAVLAVAGLAIVVVDPRAAVSVGAWLSLAAVWGTRLGSRLVSRPPLLGASMGATLATAPITAFVFGSVAPIGIAANFAAIPLAGIVVPGVFLSLVFGGVMAGGTGVFLALLERVAAIAAGMPGGHVVGEPGVLFALPWIGTLGVVVWVGAERHRWSKVRRRLVAAATVVWAAIILPPLFDRDRAEGVRLHVLDVGQGDAILVRSPRASWVLVDAGPRLHGYDAGRKVVVPFLRRHGARALSAVVASHGDADHLGGVPAVLDAIPTALVLEPGMPLGTSLYLDYLASLDEHGVEWRPARAGDAFVIDSVQFDVLHPSATWMARHLDPNESSVVLRVRYGCFLALLTGDIGWPAESLLVSAVGRVNVLKVAHHGSAGGTRDAWLDAVAPDVAVVSVGRNRYGHPAPSVLNRFTTRGIPVFRTDHAGTVTIRTDGRYFQVIQGHENGFVEEIRCLIQPLLRSNASSWSKRGCTRTQRVSLPACSTTSPSPQRSSRDTFAGPVSSIFSVRPDPPTSKASNNRSWMFSPMKPSSKQ